MGVSTAPHSLAEYTPHAGAPATTDSTCHNAPWSLYRTVLGTTSVESSSVRTESDWSTEATYVGSEGQDHSSLHMKGDGKK
jgi:hypothetical protein